MSTVLLPASTAKIRPNKYRKSLLDPSETKRVAPLVSEQLQLSKSQLLAQQITPAEFCATYITTYLKVMRPKQWRGGGHADAALAAASFSHPELHTFARSSLRSIPLAVNRSLCMWQQGSYDLRLSFDVPSPQRVLRMQCDGARCVTAITDGRALERWVLGERDPLSFLLHDLVHADHFFSKPAMMAAQIGFCRLMSCSLEKGVFDEALAQDREFRCELDYVLADMNSHGVHMVKYLKAIVTKAALRREGKPPQGGGSLARLSPAGEAWLGQLLADLAVSWGAGGEGARMLLGINTASESDELLHSVDGFLQAAATLPIPASRPQQQGAAIEATHPL